MAVLLSQSDAWIDINELRNSDSTMDMTFIANSVRIPCHRLVIAASSDFLRNILDGHPEGEILLPDFTQGAVVHLMDFIYNGELLCQSSDLSEIISLIKVLGIHCDVSVERTGLVHQSSKSGKLLDGNELVELLMLSHHAGNSGDSIDHKLLSGCEVVIESTDIVRNIFPPLGDLDNSDDFQKDDEGESCVIDDESVDGSYECDLPSPNEDANTDVLNREMESDEEPTIRLKLRNRNELPRKCKGNESPRINTQNTKMSWKNREKCRFCNLYINTKSMLNHERTVHGILKESRFPCDKCDEKFSNKQVLQKHYTLHTYGSIMFPCEQCPKIFDKSKTRSEHVSRVHKSEVCKYCCKHISGNFTHHYTVCAAKRRILKIRTKCKNKKHVQASTINTKMCRVCRKEFTKDEDTRQHELKEHGILPYPCSKCDARFVKFRELRLHLATHNPNNLPIKCKYCDQYFENLNARYCHYARDHKDTVVRCKRCKEVVPRSMYWKHSRSHRTFQCETCGRSFDCDGSLANHKLTHLDRSQWEFKCKECSSVFKRKDVLQLHIMNKHTDPALMPYRCSHCPSGFAHKSRLLVHLKRHNK